MAQDSREYWIWLQQAISLGHEAAGRILREGLRPQTLYAADEGELKALGLGGHPRLLDKSLDRARELLDRTERQGCFVLTPDDSLYPAGLRDVYGPPLALYGRGEMPDLERNPAIGLVGTRSATASGRYNASCLSAGLAAGGMTVVSGGAVGIDAAAHFGAVRSGGLTVVVKAGALDNAYPAQNEELREEIVAAGGLLVSEYPPGYTGPCNFHVRNRLISGLSVGVCLVEVPADSGALITAHHARDLGRDVFAMPGEVSSHNNDGAHAEVRQGATLITRAEEILAEYQRRYPGILDLDAAGKAQEAMAAFFDENDGPPAPARPVRRHARRMEKRKKTAPSAPAPPAPDALSAQAKTVYAVLSAEPRPVDAIADKAALPAHAVLAALTELELAGAARCCAGQQYALN